MGAKNSRHSTGSTEPTKKQPGYDSDFRAVRKHKGPDAFRLFGNEVKKKDKPQKNKDMYQKM